MRPILLLRRGAQEVRAVVKGLPALSHHGAYRRRHHQKVLDRVR